MYYCGDRIQFRNQSHTKTAASFVSPLGREGGSDEESQPRALVPVLLAIRRKPGGGGGGADKRQASERGIDGGQFGQHPCQAWIPLPSEPPGTTVLFGTQIPLLTHMRMAQTTGQPGGDEKCVRLSESCVSSMGAAGQGALGFTPHRELRSQALPSPLFSLSLQPRAAAA